MQARGRGPRRTRNPSTHSAWLQLPCGPPLSAGSPRLRPWRGQGRLVHEPHSRPCPRERTVGGGTPCDACEPPTLDTKRADMLLRSRGTRGLARGTARAANSKGTHAVGTTTATAPTRSPFPRPPRRIPSHLAPGCCTPGDECKGEHAAPRPFALQLVEGPEVGHSPPPSVALGCWSPSTLPLAVKCLKDKPSPSGFFSEPQELPPSDPPPLIKHLND